MYRTYLFWIARVGAIFGLTHSLKRRLLFGAFANSLGKVWVILIQLVSIPVLTYKWGASGYGVWMILTAVPTYIGLSDFGFGTAAAADMTRKVGVGDMAGALEAFQSVWALLSIVSALVVVIAFSLWIYRGPIAGMTGLPIPAENISATVLILVLYSVLAIQMAMLSTGYRSTQRYAIGTLLLDALIPAEGLAIIVTVVTNGGFMRAALSMLLVRSLGFLIYYRILRRFEPWIRIGWTHLSLDEIGRLAPPAFASLGANFSSALGLQGVVLAIGAAISPTAAGVFGASRTIARIPLQIAGLAVRASIPEMTVAHAREDGSLFTRLVVSNLLLTAAIVLLISIVLMTYGSWTIQTLSHGRLHASFFLVFWLLLAAGLQAGWTTVGQFLFAINRQQKFAHYYFSFAAATVFAPFLFKMNDALEKVAVVSAIAELGMLIVTSRVWWRETSMTYSQIMAAVRWLLSYMRKYAHRIPHIGR